MSGDDSNKTVFKPSPLQGLKQGGAVPPPRTTPSRPASAAAPAAAPPKPAPMRGHRDEPAVDRRGGSSEPVEVPQAAPLSAAAPAAKPAAPGPKRAKKAPRSGAFWLSLAIAAALALIIFYLLINFSGLVG